ncbi:MAG TPA: DUF2167 domain-containing protein, partial [Casimicrobium sp.]|nr:DUF2167 domain-containing protein [Casimicrobium sp.]
MSFTFASAVEAQSAMDEVRREEARKTFAAAMAVAKTGPVDVPLASQGTLKLPANYMFIPQPNATQVLNAMGNPGSDKRLQ